MENKTVVALTEICTRLDQTIKQAASLQNERNALIRQLCDTGMSKADIAAYAGIARQRVLQIVNR